MRRLAILIAILAALLAACGNQPAAAALQSDEVGPVRLAPPSSGADAQLTVQVEVGEFADAWADARSIALGAGGTVTEATTGVIREDGRRYSHGTITADLPTSRLDGALTSFGSLGTLVNSEVRLVPTSRPLATVIVTITESPSAVPSVDGPKGRVGEALDTAGDILLTMLAIAIVAGAVAIPLGLVALLGFAVWRRFANPAPPARPAAEPEPEQEPAGVS